MLGPWVEENWHIGSNLHAFRFPLRPNPNRIAFAFGSPSGNLHILFRNDKLEFFLLLLLFLGLFTFDRLQHDFGEIDISQRDT